MRNEKADEKMAVLTNVHKYAIGIIDEKPRFGVKKATQLPARMLLMIVIIETSAIKMAIVPLPSVPHRLVETTTSKKLIRIIPTLEINVLRIVLKKLIISHISLQNYRKHSLLNANYTLN